MALNTVAIAIAPIKVWRFPILLLTGAASTTPSMLAACPTARYSPLSTNGIPKKVMLPNADSLIKYLK